MDAVAGKEEFSELEQFSIIKSKGEGESEEGHPRSKIKSKVDVQRCFPLRYLQRVLPRS